MAKTQDEKRDKCYSTPKLTSYGKVHDITKAQGNMGQGDNGKPPRHKTGF